MESQSVMSEMSSTNDISHKTNGLMVMENIH